MDLGFRDAVTVVQGGTQGLGRAVAEIFAAEGAKVAVIARDPAGLEETVARLREIGATDTLALRADILRGDEIEAAFSRIGDRWGSANVLVNATGPAQGGAFEAMDDAAWLALVDQGVMGMVRCVRAALPLLRAAGWGRIVNIAAQSIRRQSPALVGYTAAKAMLASITKNLSQSLAADEILVNTISPGSFLSPPLRGWVESKGVDPDDSSAVHTLIAEHYHTPCYLPRIGQPEEIAAVIAFAASRRNSYMTGANINVDGGSDF